MIGLIKKLTNGRYLNAKIILAIDLAASLFATLCSMLFLKYFAMMNILGAFELSFLLLGGSLVASYVSFRFLKTYKAIIRHFSLRDVGKSFNAVLGKEFLFGVILFFYPNITLKPELFFSYLIFDFLLTFLCLILLRVFMQVAYDVLRNQMKFKANHQNVLVFGPVEKSLALAIRFQNSSRFNVVGLLNYGAILKNATVSGWKSYYFEDEKDVKNLISRYDISAVIFATQDAVHEESERLVKILLSSGVKTLIAPPVDVIEEGGSKKNFVREIKIEDLLGREEIKISLDEIIANFRDKVIMVTGAAGSIGSELVRQLATFGVKKLVLYDNAETPMHNLRLELEDKFPDLEFIPVIGDVRIERRLDFAFRHYHPQVVFHAAAYKHVPLMEENPCEAVLVNAVGSRFVADKCIEYDV